MADQSSLAVLDAAGWARAQAGGALPADASDVPAAQLSVLAAVELPPPGCVAPTSFAFSPDGAALACLWSPEGSLTRRLFFVDCETGVATELAAPSAAADAQLSHEEVLRRERARERGLGVTRFAWSSGGGAGRLLLPGAANELHLRDAAADAPLRTLVAPAASPPRLDPQLSPCGRLLAFVVSGELQVASAEPGRESEPPVALTSGAGGCVTHGLAEYIAAEELGRSSGFWWSHDSSAIAYARVDDARVPRYTLPHVASYDPAAAETMAYAFAGSPNAEVRVAVVRLSSPGAPACWLELCCAGRSSGAEDEYLARVAWAPGDAEVWVATLSRGQEAMQLTAFCAVSGARLRRLLAEDARPGGRWLNLSDAWKPLRAGRLLWSSERSGSRHLYLAQPSAVGLSLAQLTSGPWAVDELEAVDEEGQRAFFTAPAGADGCGEPWPVGAIERHLYSISLAPGGGGPRRLTPDAGLHSVALHSTRGVFVDCWSSLAAPPSVTLRSLADGSPLRRLFAPAPLPARARALGGLPPPSLRRFVAADGETELHAALWLPDAPKPHPLVVLVYGGPHVQTVADGWSLRCDMRAQLLRAQGFAVLKLDGRGSARRGVAFEAVLARAMGGAELEDQAAAVRLLVGEGLVEAGRVGICGWSYGGYLSALAAVRMPDVFAAAIVGAPVTSWDGYDTAYTERYMGQPGMEAEAYRRSSVLEAVRQAVAPPASMLIIHGCLDENVHWRHSARLVSALTARRFKHQLLLLPAERHMPRDAEGRAFVEAQVLSFLAAQLRVDLSP